MGCLEARDRRIRILGYQSVEQSQYKSYSCGVSPNEKYLAYPFYNEIKIVNLQTSKKIRQTQNKDRNNNIVSCLGYFENNSIMCCVINKTRIQIYRADNYFKQINTINGKNGWIHDLKIINQHYIVTCNEYNYIHITDFLKLSQVLKFKDTYTLHQTKKFLFDSLNQVIICHSFYNLNFYNMNGQILIKFNEEKHDYSIQIINNTNKLLGSRFEFLVLWQIDYQKRKLIRLKKFDNERSICRTQLYLQSFIILLDHKYLTILNINDFGIIYAKAHIIGDFMGKYSNIDLINLQRIIRFNLREPQINIYSSDEIALQRFLEQ